VLVLSFISRQPDSGCLSYLSLASAAACASCRHAVLPIEFCLPCMLLHGRSHVCAGTAVCKRLGHIALCYLTRGAAAASAARERAVRDTSAAL